MTSRFTVDRLPTWEQTHAMMRHLRPRPVRRPLVLQSTYIQMIIGYKVIAVSGSSAQLKSFDIHPLLSELLHTP